MLSTSTLNDLERDQEVLGSVVVWVVSGDELALRYSGDMFQLKEKGFLTIFSDIRSIRLYALLMRDKANFGRLTVHCFIVGRLIEGTPPLYVEL